MLRDALEVLKHNDRARAEAVAAQNRCVDQLGGAIRRYLADVGGEQTLDNQREGARGQDILSAVINLEHIADIVANSLVEFAVRSVKRGRALSPEELETVDAMHGELLESLRLALAVFLQAEPRDAKRLAARKAQFREFEAAATALSVRLLRAAAAASRLGETDGAERIAEESDLFLRTVRDLRRVHSHLASFAYPIIHRVRSRSQSRHRGRRRRGQCRQCIRGDASRVATEVCWRRCGRFGITSAPPALNRKRAAAAPSGTGAEFAFTAVTAARRCRRSAAPMSGPESPARSASESATAAAAQTPPADSQPAGTVRLPTRATACIRLARPQQFREALRAAKSVARFKKLQQRLGLQLARAVHERVLPRREDRELAVRVLGTLRRSHSASISGTPASS